MAENSTIQKTALFNKHVALGAKMVPFAGFEMPLQYEGLKPEHLAVRNGVGMFDVSHMGEFMVTGPEALKLINWISSNDASVLEDGKVQYACMPNGKGGIVDDLLIYRMSPERYMLVVNASNIEKDWNWIKSQNRFDAQLSNLSDNLALLAVQGPKATEAISSLTDMDLASMPYYTHQSGKFAGIDDILISTTGYTGAGGYEIYIPNSKAETIWDAIIEAGKASNLQPAGLAARDTLRLEMGFCLYGNDIDDQTSPIEAGLGWITKFTKDFVDRDTLEKQKSEKPNQRLVGLEMIDRGIPRQGYGIEDADGNEIGKITSGTMAPSLDKAIGMGYVKRGHGKTGNEVFVAVRNKKLKAQIVKFPFYKG